MNRLLWILGFAVVFGACTNEGGTTGKNAAADSTDHSAHMNTSAGATTPSADTTAIAGQTMMSLMHRNMDQMKAIQTTGNPDNDFAALMKVHHMGAVEMAQLEVARGADPQLKQMAQRIIDAQQQEIAQFNTFLSGHTAHGGGEAYYKEVMGQMNNMKMDMNHSGSIDQQFAEMMIPHHQGGIDMARAYLKAGAHEEQLKTMATKIIADQQKEINELQAWLNKNK